MRSRFWRRVLAAAADPYGRRDAERRWAREQALRDVARWIEDEAFGEDEPVREFAASIAARIRASQREDRDA